MEKKNINFSGQINNSSYLIDNEQETLKDIIQNVFQSSANIISNDSFDIQS